MNRREDMRTFQNQIKGLAIAALVAVALVNAAPAFADQAITIRKSDGSKACVMLAGVASNTPEWVASTLDAVMEALGCS
jgi:hypothetical protein